MVHYLNVCDVSGKDIEPVDIITFGSPCQDLSVAGKQTGLSGSRSGLFTEAVRIIKEMKESTGGEYPKYALWENVPGTFSSNKGEDFRTVLEELCRICDETVSIPRPTKQKWRTAGTVVGDGWSVAWRVLDAKYYGVPQRRRRIFLVTDFTGERAAEILFESEGVSRDFTPCGSPWKGTAGNAETGIGTSSGSLICLNDQGGSRMDVLQDMTATLRAKSRSVGYEEERSPTLRAGVVPGVAIENHPTDGRCKVSTDGKVQTLTSRMGTGGMNTPLVLGTPKTLKIRSGCEGGGKGTLVQDDMSTTISCNNDQTVFVPTAYGICSDKSNSMLSDNPHSSIYEAETSRTIDANGGNPGCNQGGIAVVFENHPSDGRIKEEIDGVCQTLTSRMGIGGGNHPPCVMNSAVFDNHGKDTRFTGPIDVAPTISATYGTDGNNQPFAVTLLTDEELSENENYSVRRITPTECQRLQGFPENWACLNEMFDMTDEEYDFWTNVRKEYAKVNGKKFADKSKEQTIKWYNKLHTDSSEYKMWGNGVALPCVLVPIGEMAKRGCNTLGSLFDGSGGFPLAGVICGIEPLWRSEIEPYPIAVTRSRFG